MTYSVTPMGNKASIPRIRIFPIVFMCIPDSQIWESCRAGGACGKYYSAREWVPRTLSLIGSHQLRLRQHMALHGLFQLCLGRMFEVRQDGIERIELVKIPVPADRRAGAARTGGLPGVWGDPGPGRRR